MTTFLEHARGVLARHALRAGTTCCGQCGRKWSPATPQRPYAGCVLRLAAYKALAAATRSAEEVLPPLMEALSETPATSAPGPASRQDQGWLGELESPPGEDTP